MEPRRPDRFSEAWPQVGYHRVGFDPILVWLNEKSGRDSRRAPIVGW